MDGKYLDEARSQMHEACDEIEDGVQEHGLLSLAALTEAFAELEARVTRLEAGPRSPVFLTPDVSSPT